MTFIETGDTGTNFERVFASRPEVYAAWRQLVMAIQANMDPRRYELATLAAARRMGSSYCMLAHGSLLAREHLPAETVAAAATDHHAAGLEPLEVAVMDLADQVATDATSVTQADVDRLRELGLTDPEILDVILTAAARSFFTKVIDGSGAQPDASYNDLDPALRDVLTVGRPIAAD